MPRIGCLGLMGEGEVGVVQELVMGTELFRLLHPKAFPVGGDPMPNLMEHVVFNSTTLHGH